MWMWLKRDMLLIYNDFWLNDSPEICLITELIIIFKKSKTILRKEFSFFVAALYWWKERMCWLTFTKNNSVSICYEHYPHLKAVVLTLAPLYYDISKRLFATQDLNTKSLL